MMKKILVVGFGRMGITHATILSGILGSDNCAFYVADPSRLSRSAAKLLLPGVTTLHPKRLAYFCESVGFDYALVTTPPTARASILNVITESCDQVFVEKPVLGRLAENHMSGYVLQHCPLNSKLSELLIGRSITRVSARLFTNVDFEDENDTWRGGDYGSALHEFGGHLMTVVGAVMKESAFLNETFLDSLDVIKHSRNETEVRFFDAGSKFEIIVGANRKEFRKASYEFTFTCDTGEEYYYDLYTIREGNDRNELFSLSGLGVKVPFYLRGFEFTNQMVSLLEGNRDVLTSEQIFNIEQVLSKTSGMT